MCGIVGYVGSRDATSVLISGLRKLEYRGYDSAGIAIVSAKKTEVLRCRGKLSALEKLLVEKKLPGTLGIGHTRWATHGRPSDENAHPHRSGAVSVVHNLSLIHISEPTRRTPISYAVFCLKKKNI